jgi:hypothetical protein
MIYEAFHQEVSTSLISFTEDSHAKISLLQDFKKAWKESEAVFFSKYSESWMRSKLPSYSLKTCQTLGLKEQNEFAKNYPKEGMIVDGVIYPLQMWERDIKEKDGSYWAAPTVVQVGNRSPAALEKKRLKRLATGRKSVPCGSLEEQVKYGYPIKTLFPTPKARDWKDKASPSEYNRNTPTLATHAGGPLNPMWVEWLMGYHTGWTELKPSETV